MKHLAAESGKVDEVGEGVLPWQAAQLRVTQALAATAVERDQRGGTPKAERDLLRESGLLMLSVPAELGGLGAN
jgi:alkylation response protein AidB-like acyl-CoA dehydrogenase